MKLTSIQDTYTLANGKKIPCVGFGTFLTPDGAETVDSVKEALRIGYRLIDTASVYGNERSVGQAVRESGVDRNEIFLTSKLWNRDQGYESTLEAFDRTMKALGTDYLDLYLIHWPIGKGHEQDWAEMNRESWRAMEKLYRDGYIGAIAVSNFMPHHIDSLMVTATIPPMVDQIEIHPGLNHTQAVEYCRTHGIIVEAWGPLSQGRLSQMPALNEIAGRHGKTVAQVCLRWHLQRGIVPLPKSVTPSRIEENTRIFDFELTDEEMDFIGHIQGPVGSGADPDKVAH